jgi:hypothetical protein
MSKTETESLLKHAKDVASSKECSKEEVDELILSLQTQQRELYNRLDKVKKTLHSLEVASGSPDRKTDELRDTVRAIYRIFQLSDKASGNDYPALSKPTGWSGEINDGPKTAYDVLPPKKYKP